jgi:carboxyl-terminal processing protease
MTVTLWIAINGFVVDYLGSRMRRRRQVVDTLSIEVQSPRMRQHSRRYRRRLAPVLLVPILAVLAFACGVAVEEPTPTAAPPTATQVVATTPTPDASLLEQGGIAIVQRAYERLLDAYIQPLESSRILDGAWTTMAVKAGEQGLEVPIKPAFADDRVGDFLLFRAAYAELAEASPDTDQLRYATIRGMAQALQDCHTFFLSPVASNTLNDAREGAGTVGIGVDLAGVPPVVTEVITSGPADRAGVALGDRIVEIDGVDGRNFGPASAWERINGEEGTQVSIAVERPGAADLIDFTMTRERVNPPNVESRVIGGAIGYVRIRNFVDGGVSAELRRKIDEFEGAGVTSWIVDVRGNPGGRLDTGSISLFVPSGVAVRDQNRLGEVNEELVSGNVLPVVRPLVLLTNNRTGSVAEVFAVALKEHGVAFVVGAPTNGCAGYTVVEDLGDGSSLAVTSHVNIGPVSGTVLSGIGVAPDLAVPRTAEDIAVALDPQLDAAVAHLQATVSSP